MTDDGRRFTVYGHTFRLSATKHIGSPVLKLESDDLSYSVGRSSYWSSVEIPTMTSESVLEAAKKLADAEDQHRKWMGDCATRYERVSRLIDELELPA